MATKRKVVTARQISEVMSEMGRRGGSVTGVKKGFAALPPKKASEAARRAAMARWGKKAALPLVGLALIAAALLRAAVR